MCAIMAYLRKEKEIVEMDYPLNAVWNAILQAVKSLDWVAEEDNKKTRIVKAKTRGAFLSYSSTLMIEAVAKGEQKTRVTVSAETPVTMITGLIDFGRTQERIDSFIYALTAQITPESLKPKAKDK
jgi:hypothetical protein